METCAAAPQPETPALVIDGSGSAVFAGILSDSGTWRAQLELTGAPLECLFPLVKQVLHQAGLTLADLRSFLYCEGPGSVLGMRLCAMAIETWTRLYPDAAACFAYNSLQLTAALLLADNPGLGQALLVSDWKKGAWNAVHITDGHAQKTGVVDDEAIAAWTGPLYHLPQRKGWQKPPSKALQLSYNPRRIDEMLRQQPGLLHQTEGVQLYATGINTFRKWTPERHRAPEKSQISNS